MELVKTYAEEIALELNGWVELDEIMNLIEQPKFDKQGDLAFPCFTLAKAMKKSPAKIAEQLAARISNPYFEQVIAEGPYVNCFYNKSFVSLEVIRDILHMQSDYGASAFGQTKTVTLDFSSPNIAKPFSMGHLRSTVIGNSLALISEKCGYKAIRINHLGDWGTQFGKLITAYKLWGSEQEVKDAPISELLKLYVKFHQEAGNNTELESEARLWFKKLEDGNPEAQKLWKWFREESLQEFSKIYSLLDIGFDSNDGESFYNDKMDEVVKLLRTKQLLVESNGAEVVDLSDYSLPPFLIRKRDGATLYGTRDLAAALYRKRNYQFDQSFYVVGQEQTLHFKQLSLVLEKLGYDWPQDMKHVSFGFILKNGRKMSTRKGGVVLLEHVIQQAIDLAENNIAEKNSALPDKRAVAKMVGIGAIIFHDLKNDRQNNIEFSLADMLKFEGATGPYVQYTHARACSILTKSSFKPDQLEPAGLNDEHSWPIIKLLLAFPEVIAKSFDYTEPSQIAKYLILLAQEFNSYYAHVKILNEDIEQEGRVALVQAVAIVLKEGLRLLGIKAPEKM
ncbi:arginine--tRNA ligase [Planococcus soli]|uniref:arginine--tRNA ligase n=1 Tax=Planococcus soli TaxID=2666072 RepID=UPI00115E5DDF|nr:arginine--tRNA ligase [Planococcus soli]